MDFSFFSKEIFENLGIYSEEKLTELYEEMEIYSSGFNIVCNKINRVLEEVFLGSENAVEQVEQYEKIFFGNLQAHNDINRRKENICMFLGLNNKMFSKKYIENQLLARDIKYDINIKEDTSEVTLENIYYKNIKTELKYVKNILDKIFPVDILIKENTLGLSWLEWEEKELSFLELDNLNLKWSEL